MSDLIDRQALLKQIDIDSDGEPGYYGDTWKFIDTIKSMPSAELDSDTISRQAAIDALDGEITVTGRANAEAVRGYARLVADRLKRLPSAQPERKRGRWVYAEDEYGIDGYHCNQCGFFVPWDYAHKFINYIEDYHLCPNCGADMRGEHDG